MLDVNCVLSPFHQIYVYNGRDWAKPLVSNATSIHVPATWSQSGDSLYLYGGFDECKVMQEQVQVLNLTTMEVKSFTPRLLTAKPAGVHTERQCAVVAQDGSGHVILFGGGLVKSTYARLDVSAQTISYYPLANDPGGWSSGFPASTCALVGDLLYYFLVARSAGDRQIWRNYGVINVTSNRHVASPNLLPPPNGVPLAIHGAILRINATAVLYMAGCVVPASAACREFSQNVTLLTNMDDPTNLGYTAMQVEGDRLIPSGLCKGTPYSYVAFGSTRGQFANPERPPYMNAFARHCF